MMTRIKHLYIHVPFCNSICSYCDFCHRIYNKEIVEKWLKTLSLETNDKCKDEYETIYIGGGTPSCLDINELEMLLSLIEPFSRNVKEYTIEVNPESLNIDKILIFKKYGINRISMGVQTSDDNLLKLLNRKHSYEDVKNSIRLLKENSLENISIDLMYSLPNQTMEILEQTINDFIKLDIPHVSLYSLTIEENTIFSKKGYKSLDEEIEADMYDLIVRRLEENGYMRYEVSNFSKQGYESKHNIGYWKYDDFLGISLGASGKIGNTRYTNTENFDKYFCDYDYKDEYLELEKKDLMFENIMMSLRMRDGIDLQKFNKKYNINFIEYYANALKNSNLILSDNKLRVKDLAILNNTLLDFMEE